MDKPHPSRRPVMRTAALSVSPLEMAFAALVWLAVLATASLGQGVGSPDAPAQIEDFQAAQTQPSFDQPSSDPSSKVQAPSDENPSDAAAAQRTAEVRAGDASPAATQTSKPAAPKEAPHNGAAEAQRLAVWNSPEMQFALAWLQEYFRTSRQSPPEVEQAYLARLEQLPAEDLKQWLDELGRTHRQTAQQNRAFEKTRRELLATAASRQARSQPMPSVSRPPYNYVQPMEVQRPFEGRAYSDRYAPLRSFEIVHYLDTLQIREDVRALRNGSGP